MARLLFALSAPWTAALSWQDLMILIFQTPGRIVFHSDAALVILGLAPLAALLAGALALDRGARESERRLRAFALLMLAFFTALMAVLYLRDAPIPLSERHFRPVAMLLFLCLLALAMRPGGKTWLRYGLLGLFGALGCYGLASFGARAISAQRQTVDPSSWTIQPRADAASVTAIRRGFDGHGRDALFYLGAPELSATLPPDARMIVEAPELMSESAIAAVRYHGRVKGPVHVLVSNQLPQAKAEAVLRSFVDYPPAGWSKAVFERATVYRQ